MRLLSTLRLDGQSIQPEAAPDASFVSTAIALVDEDAAVDNVFEVLFREVLPPPETDGGGYLVVTWIMFPADEVGRGTADSPEVLGAINRANAEPGTKLRVEVDGDSEVVLCEAELPLANLNLNEVEAALAHTRDVVALHFDTLEPLVRGR